MGRPTTGIRKIQDIEGGLIAWLYGPTDLDDVLLALAAEAIDQDLVDLMATTWHRTEGPDPDVPDGLPDDGPEAAAAWDAYWARRPRAVQTIDEEHPTFVPGPAEVDVGWFRQFPWCNCGEGHSWHYDRTVPGPGASLAVVVTGVW